MMNITSSGYFYDVDISYSDENHKEKYSIGSFPQLFEFLKWVSSTIYWNKYFNSIPDIVTQNGFYAFHGHGIAPTMYLTYQSESKFSRYKFDIEFIYLEHEIGLNVTLKYHYNESNPINYRELNDGISKMDQALAELNKCDEEYLLKMREIADKYNSEKK